MSGRKQVVGLAVAGLLTAALAGIVAAQDQTPAPATPAAPAAQPAPEGGRGGRGGRMFDPAQMRQRMGDRIKEQIKANDDEWKVLQPHVDKLITISMELRTAGLGMMGGRGRGPGAGMMSGAPENPLAQKMQALGTLLDNPSAKPEEITAAVKAVREAREQLKAELAKEQAATRELLTPAQEAQLVMIGMLD